MLLAASVAALYAIWISPLPLNLMAAIALFVCTLSIYQLTTLSRTRILNHDPQAQLWTVSTTQNRSYPAIKCELLTTGMLVNGGYRSAGLLILLLQSDDSRYHRIAIWRDQLDPVQFSYLHYQLAYACQTASRRTVTAWLKS